MAELAHFQNFAKLKDTSIEFNDITVLAGKPGTGKSYVMKMMYAIDEVYSLKTSFEEKNTDEAISLLSEIETSLNKLDNSDKEYGTKMANILKDTLKAERLADNKDFHFGTNYNNLLKSIFVEHNQISENFEVAYLDTKIKFLNTILNVSFDNNKKNISDIIFVETPLILEFKSFITREKGKTPYHIESLLKILDKDFSFPDDEQDKFIKSFREKAQTIIGGDIESTGDSFIFNRKDDKNYDILNASSGIKSIGLLQYLVTNKALKKGSVLFWEEPEVHLHPSWQLKMVDLFVELMNAGVKIVFSTHSPYMADYLNAISQKNEFKERVSFNLLKESESIVENIILDEDSWHEIQTELLDPLEEIVWEYL